MSVFGRWLTGSPKEEDAASAAGGTGPDRAASAAAAADIGAVRAPSGGGGGASSSLQQRTTSASSPGKAAVADAHGPAGVTPVEVVEHDYDSPEPDLYRTFSPSDVAFWDLKRPADGSGSGFFSKLFGGGASGKQQ